MPSRFNREGPVVFSAVPRAIRIGIAAEGTYYQFNDPCTEAGSFTDDDNALFFVFHPGIQITKECVTTCPPPFGNSPYGQPIQFTGLICNTGDVALLNIQVTDDPATSITISNMTVDGMSFTGTLGTNKCVRYSGSYQPTGNMCGPFTDRITVVATPTGVGGDTRSVSNSATATCTVCTAPNVCWTKV